MPKEGTSLGELEQAIMNLLWDATEPLTANQVRDALAHRQYGAPAITTVLTVLGRLSKKGFVTKDSSKRPHEFASATSREDHTVQLLNDVLGSAVDKHAVLARFIGGIDPSDAQQIRYLLQTRES
ncbi:MAG TPA: BlaI/MecI/CopY family transcriptional regulator [Candidatus Yaniella excrementigallinarum]|nr:BlaI/MecI/CopY family transcriptional regulator [Candidatus Yaniella excrementigallinarum]